MDQQDACHLFDCEDCNIFIVAIMYLFDLHETETIYALGIIPHKIQFALNHKWFHVKTCIRLNCLKDRILWYLINEGTIYIIQGMIKSVYFIGFFSTASLNQKRLSKVVHDHISYKMAILKNKLTIGDLNIFCLIISDW